MWELYAQYKKKDSKRPENSPKTVKYKNSIRVPSCKAS